MAYSVPLSYFIDHESLNRPSRSCRNCVHAIRISETIQDNRRKKELKHPRTFRVQEYVKCYTVRQIMTLEENKDMKQEVNQEDDKDEKEIKPVIVNVWFGNICPFFKQIGEL